MQLILMRNIFYWISTTNVPANHGTNNIFFRSKISVNRVSVELSKLANAIVSFAAFADIFAFLVISCSFLLIEECKDIPYSLVL